MRLALSCALVGALSISLVLDGDAAACGCFLPPDPIQPLVQTGERILFRVKNGIVTAHVQIAFGGSDASQFGWTVPVPSVPTLGVGDDAIFNALLEETGGQFSLEERRECAAAVSLRAASSSGCGCPFDGNSGGGSYRPGGFFVPASPDIVVIRSTVGPYDFAVLKADDKTDLVDWLNLNRFFLPTASDEALKPYVGPGRYFLALKLRAGAQAGDIKPIVLTYASDLPMIPLTLTAATVAPQLPVQVWVLGSARAIPRNYHHVVLDDALYEWRNKVANLERVLGAAVAEAPGGKAFVTQYAGPSQAVAAKVPAAFASLFEGAPMLTRLDTLLGAKSLDRDPVFSENPDLPPVPRGHDAVITDFCDGTGELATPLGFRVPVVADGWRLPAGLPSAARIEILREAGPPEVVVDNGPLIAAALAGVAPPRRDLGGAPPESLDGGDDGDDGSVGNRQVRVELLLASLLPLTLLARALRRRRR